MVRGGLAIVILPLFKLMRTITGHYISGGWITGIIIMLMAIIAAYYTKESFATDLNFLEE